MITQGFKHVTARVDSLGKRSQILYERDTDSFHFCFAQQEMRESNSCITTF